MFSHMTKHTIGHILRDQYNVYFKKLTKEYPQLNQVDSEVKALERKIMYLDLHVKKNKKDYPSLRSLSRLKVKLWNLKRRLNE